MDSITTLLMTVLATLIAMATLATKIAEYQLFRMKQKKEAGMPSDSAVISQPIQATSKLRPWVRAFAFSNLLIYLISMGFLLHYFSNGSNSAATFRDVAFLVLLGVIAITGSRPIQR